MRQFIFALIVFKFYWGFSQADSSAEKFSFSGYVEVYYTFDFNQPQNHTRPNFIYSHNRHNEFNLNLGFVKGTYSTERIRANFALAAGTYMNANYAAEPGVLRNIYEGNAGFKISKKKNTWIDAGIFASHIGFESAVSKDCWGLTRSILADNSPYYESGIKITHQTVNEKWTLSFLVLNGWQHIQRPVANNTPAFGSQITYSPSEKLIINYSNFVGNEQPDSLLKMRYFNNFYTIWYLNKKIHLTTGFDFGMEQVSKNSNNYNVWLSPVLITKFNLNNTWSVTGRIEYYQDENGVIIATGTPNGFKTLGYSINLDYQIRTHAFWRLEGRLLQSEDNIFMSPNGMINQSIFVTSSIAIAF